MTAAEMRRQIKLFERALKHAAEKEVREAWRKQGWVYVRGYTVSARMRPYKQKDKKRARHLKLVA